MRKLIYFLSLFILFNCKANNVKEFDKETPENINDKKVIKKIIQEDNSSNYIIADLFFYRDIANGELLSTSEGMLQSQSQRAAIFVPPGSGTEEKPVFEKIKIDKQSIILKHNKSNQQISYHLFNYSTQDGAVIIIVEKGLKPRIISYSGIDECFVKKEISDFFPSAVLDIFNHLAEIKIEENMVVVTSNTIIMSYLWKDSKFQEVEKD